MAETQVLDVKPQGGNKYSLTVQPLLDMRPEGGGQPGDSGTFSWDGGEGSILNTRKNPGGGLLLDVSLKKGQISKDTAISVFRDDLRREILTRMHSGEHILSRVMEDMKPELQVYKVAVGEDKTAVYFHCDGQIDWDFLFSAEDKARSVIKAALPVQILEMPIEKAKVMEGLKARWDRVKDETIRVVKIGDFDLNACSGTHVQDTSEVGELCVESFKGSSPEWEVTFSLGDRFSYYSRKLRRLISELHCGPDDIEKIIQRLSDENSRLKKQLAKVGPHVVIPWEETELETVKISCGSFIGFPPELVSSAARRKSEDFDGVVLALMDDGESPKIPFTLLDPKGYLDTKKLLSNQELGARGGGKNGMVSGQTTCKSLPVWLKLCRQEVSVGK